MDLLKEGTKGKVALIKAVCRNTGLSYSFVEELLDQIGMELADLLAQGRAVTIPHFGAFNVFVSSYGKEKQHFKYVLSKDFKRIVKKGGIDANNALRQIGFLTKRSTESFDSNSDEE